MHLSTNKGKIIIKITIRLMIPILRIQILRPAMPTNFMQNWKKHCTKNIIYMCVNVCAFFICRSLAQVPWGNKFHQLSVTKTLKWCKYLALFNKSHTRERERERERENNTTTFVVFQDLWGVLILFFNTYTREYRNINSGYHTALNILLLI